MKTLNGIFSRNVAILMVLILGAGCGVQQATAQYDNQGYNDQNYNNGNNGYNNQNYNNGYNDQNHNNGNQGYNDQNYNNGYNNQQGYGNGYNNQGYNNGNYSYDNGDYREFYNDLAPYGQWLSDPQYGYVWAPYGAGNSFRPYFTNGYWVMTDYGNTWVSNYPWGWATFHYGRWAQSNYYGWIWIPGNTWGPAWVNWRQGGGYYGWAPMGPGISISFSFGSGYNVPNPWWTFIPCVNIYSNDYSRYYSPRQTVNIINNTTIINNTYVDNRSRNTYVTGPRRTEVEAVTRRKVNVYQVNNAPSNGATQIKGQNVSFYRPTIKPVTAAEQTRIAPTQVKRLETSAVTNPGGGRAPIRQAAPSNATIGNQAPRGGNTSTTKPTTLPPNMNQGRNTQVGNAPAVRQPNLNPSNISTQQQQAQQTQRIQQQQQAQQLQQQRAQDQAQQLRQQQAQQLQQQRVQEQAQQQRQQQQAQQLQQQRAQQQAQQLQQQQQRAQQQQMQQQQQQRAQQQQLQQQQQRAQQQQRVQQQQIQQQQRVQPQPVQRAAPPKVEEQRR